MNTAPQILILDDHAMIRKGIRLTIETTFGIKDIEEVSSCAGLLKYLRHNQVTHLLLDLLVSDGNTLEIIPVIKNYTHIYAFWSLLCSRRKFMLWH